MASIERIPPSLEEAAQNLGANFHRRELFRPQDLARIEHAEAGWLKKAQRVIFRSDWFGQRAVQQYGLDPARVFSVGNFGEIGAPAGDTYAGGKQFAFVSTSFAAKGGNVVLAAFREVREKHPDASLVIIGDQPSPCAEIPGVNYAGYLRKEDAAEVAQFKLVLSRSRALVHPTQSDTNPAIIVEAGYFGCPAISLRKFAIPEVVEHGRTGLLLEEPLHVGDLVRAMNWMLEAEDEYQAMRRAAWAKANGQHTKKLFEARLIACVCDVLAEGVQAP